MSTSLPKTWRVVYPEDIVSEPRAIVSGPFGSNIGKRFFVGDGVPVIRGNNLTLGKKRFIDEGFVFLTEEKSKEFKNCQAIAGDLVFTAAGTLGQVGLIPENSRFSVYIISNKQLRLRPDIKKAFPEYLYYWFSSVRIRNYIIGLNTGSSVPLITLGKLRSVPINLPPIQVQRKIVDLLAAYDHLIENNTRRIKILEEMARLIYREWFVDFKAPGIKLRKATPEENKVTGKDVIPEGWEVKQIINFGVVATGKTQSKERKDFYGDFMQFIKTPDMHGNMFILNTSDKLSQLGAESQRGKILPPDSIYVSCIGTVGVISITTEPAQTNQQINSITLKEEVAREYLFYALQNIVPTMKQYAGTGATMDNLSKGKFESLNIVSPSDSILEKFNSNVSSMFDEIKKLSEKILNLRQTRDLLLPKLISGEVEV